MLARASLLAVSLALTAPGTFVSFAAGDDFEMRLRPFLETHCVGCHGPDVQKGKLRLDTLPAKFDDKEASTTWIKVLERGAGGARPPKTKRRPPKKDVQAVMG